MSDLTITPTQQDAMAALRAFLLAALPDGREVVLGQANKVPEVSSPNFAVMTPMRRQRLETNTRSLADCRLIGSLSGNVLTVTTVDYGAIALNRVLWGANIATGTKITKMLTGTGGVGTYQVSVSQNVASELMACGVVAVYGPYQLTVQIDFHGPGASSASADDAQTTSALFRDLWGTDFFQTQNANVVPLYADEPRQIPFINAESQFEDRWIVEANLQVNETVNVPQQYADVVTVGLIDVDVEYPA